MESSFLEKQFTAAHTYDHHVHAGTAEQQRRWRDVHDAAALTAPQRTLVGGFVRDMKVLVISGVWCGDCVAQCPLIQRIAEANRPRINLRFLDRDQHLDLAGQLKLNAGLRVPVIIFMAEDFEFCALAGDRTISRYRAMAAQRLGPACPAGIIPPGADELAATLQDWVQEFERVELMLRLSPRLRQKHGD